MICNFSETSFADTIRTFSVNDGEFNQFPLVTLGKKSYVVNAIVETVLNKESNHLLIGNYSSIAHNVSFLINANHDYNHVTTYPLEKICSSWKAECAKVGKGQIIIGNDVWIGRCATILDGVVIGNGAIVAANAVVTKNVPPYAIAAGNPASVVRYRFSEEIIHKLNTIKWWYWEKEKILQNREFFESMSLAGLDLLYHETAKYSKHIGNTNFSRFKAKYLFIPDFKSPYPVWEKVINEYINQIALTDDVVLVLWMPTVELYSKEIDAITHIAASKEKGSIVCLDGAAFEDEIELLSQVDYFISTRDAKSLKYVDYAYDLKVEFLSGMNCPVFK